MITLNNVAMATDDALEALSKLSAMPSRKPKPATFPLGDRVAVVELVGYIDGDNSALTQARLSAAARDPNIREILFMVDSPGGFAGAAFPLAEAVAEAAAVKPVHGYVMGVAASGAYMAISQCTTITGSAWCTAGSIGTYTVLTDTSELLRRAGIRVIPVKAGNFKATAMPGVEITDEQIVEVERFVNSINAIFLKLVRTGRKVGLRGLASLADGRVWVGAEAVQRKLVDKLQPMSEFMRESLTRNPHEEFLDLYGAAAATKFASLLGVKKVEDIPSADSAVYARVVTTYPTLAENALKYKPPTTSARRYEPGRYYGPGPALHSN